MTNTTLKHVAAKHVVLLVALAICAIAYFLPYILYVSHLAGLPVADARKTLNVDIDLGNDWFPIASSSSFLGRFLISKNLPPTVMFYRCSWTSPWRGEDAYLSRISLPPDWIDSQKNPAFIEIGGSKGVLVSNEVTGVSERQFVVVPSWSLSFSLRDMSVIKNIVIRK
jgi:hypothetical protein